MEIGRRDFLKVSSGAIASISLKTASAQDAPKSQATPSAVAREAFASLKRNDIPAFVALMHPAEFARFKEFATDVFKFNDTDGQTRQIRGLFAPYDSEESAAAANGSDLLAAFLKNMFTANPGFQEILSNAELEILGEIEEAPDKVHVITRTVLPRPSPTSCQKHDGRWYQLLNAETMRMMTAFRQLEYIGNQELLLDALAQNMTIEKVDALGHVLDGEGVAQVLCRVNMKLKDLAFPIFGCYPVRKGDPAWEHLDDEDKTELVKAMREKWGQ